MNFGAIAHMPDQRYCFCLRPGRFLFRLQTGREDIQTVTLHYQDKYIPTSLLDTRQTMPMKLVARDGAHDYFEAELDMDVVCLRYFFELVDVSGTCRYYANGRFYRQKPEDIDRMYDCPQTLREAERFSAPKWAENAVVYQIFPARFASHTPVDENVWYQAPINGRAELGGSLKGIQGRLEYLRELGVDVLYLTPVFLSRSVHKYDTVDYYTIDPSFGTNDDLVELVAKAHEMGLRVMLDGVFNHTAPEFFAFRDLMENWETSPYRAWYYCDEKPVIPETRLEKPNFKCFGYFGGMPKLNLENPETAAYFIDVALYWLRTAGIDGWRLDVGDEVSHRFWTKFRDAVKAEFPEALIVGEIWHYAGDFLQGDNWDSVMNYPFLNAAMDWVADGTMTATEFVEALGFLRGNLNNSALPLLWNLLGSHDTPRALHRCGGDKEKLRLLAALQLLLPGMPMIYYGDEVGLAGGRDPDCRRGMLWDEKRQDGQLLQWYRRLLHVRKTCLNLTREEPLAVAADDEKGLVLIDHGTHLLAFHAGAGDVELDGLAGAEELLSQSSFDGVLHGYQAAVLCRATK